MLHVDTHAGKFSPQIFGGTLANIEFFLTVKLTLHWVISCKVSPLKVSQLLGLPIFGTDLDSSTFYSNKIIMHHLLLFSYWCHDNTGTLVLHY